MTNLGRQGANRKLLAELAVLVEKHHDCRLGQLIYNVTHPLLDKTNLFYVEPQAMLDAIEKAKKEGRF